MADPGRGVPEQAGTADAMFHPLPVPTPVAIPRVSPDGMLSVVAFYCPGCGLTEWDRRTNGAPFGNFWPLAPQTITVTHNGASGVFHSTEAAYQCMKWWQHAPTRAMFEGCDAPDLTGGGMSYSIKKDCEGDADGTLQPYMDSDYDGLGKYGAMLTVLRLKWRLPYFKEMLLKTSGVFLVEHCEVKGRDPYWTDDFSGGGENRLGAALMEVRAEILEEAGVEDLGWPGGVQRPPWSGGPEDSNWQAVVDGVAEFLVAETREEPLTAPRLQ